MSAITSELPGPCYLGVIWGLHAAQPHVQMPEGPLVLTLQDASARLSPSERHGLMHAQHLPESAACCYLNHVSLRHDELSLCGLQQPVQPAAHG